MLIPVLNRIKPGSRIRDMVQYILEALEYMTGVLLPVLQNTNNSRDSYPRALQEQLLYSSTHLTPAS